MSRTLELAFEKAKKSKYKFKDGRVLEVEDAVIIWPDFSGKVTEYHKTLGEKRSFNLVLNDDAVAALKDLEKQTGAKFRIREKTFDVVEVEKSKPITIKVHYINVKVNMESNYPPIVTLYTEYNGKRSHKTLNKDTISVLDRTDIKCADMLLNCYNGKMHPEQLTAYLKKLNVIQEPDVEFGGKYDDWEDVNNQPEEVVNPATGDVEND